MSPQTAREAPNLSSVDSVWSRMRIEAATDAAAEPILASFLSATILNHSDFKAALSYRLAQKLSDTEMNAMLWRQVAEDAYRDDHSIVTAALADIQAYVDRDPATRATSQPFLYFKGFQAIQSHRIGHWLWKQRREALALYLQSRMSELFQVDIHPAAQLGHGLFVDHATGIVVGETARVGNNCSLLHSVTLGGTGREKHQRHPRLGNGVLVGAGAKVLGDIEVGDGAKIASGSVVLQPVKPFCTVAGVPAVPVGKCAEAAGEAMDQRLNTEE
ncbi:MAG: serine O-acetyltransferase [Pseudomonadota bacterium]